MKCTIMSSISDALLLKWVQMSMANTVLLLLNIDVSDDIRADNITANIIPRAPVGQKVVQIIFRDYKIG